MSRLALCRHTALLIVALWFSGSAAAYSKPCYVEIRAFCADIAPGDGRWTACAVSNRDRYSVACRTEVHAVIEQRPIFLLACRESVARLCPNIKAGSGRIYSCLKFNEPEVPLACQQHLN